MGEPHEKPFGPADVAQPVRVLVLHHVPDKLRAASLKPWKHFVNVIDGPLVKEVGSHLATFTESGGDAYVFTSPNGTPLELSNLRYRVWVPATKAAGLDGLRFHDLRHTAGTLAARTGATTKELMARLGHASPQAAMVYQHAAEDRDRLIAERLAAMTEELDLAPVVAIRASGGESTGKPPARKGHRREVVDSSAPI